MIGEAQRQGASTSEIMSQPAEFLPGCYVRVAAGPFAGVEGMIESKRGENRSLIALDLLQIGVTLEIDDCRLEAISSSSRDCRSRSRLA